MTRRSVVLCLSLTALGSAEPRARNVILFMGDAAGLGVLNAAAIHGGKPQGLFIQKMPNIGLMDTSSASQWVTDSAAAMTAIVTGRKTHNGVISQSEKAVRGKQDGEVLKTILEYAEERGLSTGVITNDRPTGATAAACYAHSNDRKNAGEIFAQVFQPRFGDGVDVLIGAGGRATLELTRKLGLDPEARLSEKGYQLVDAVENIPAGARRVVALPESADFDLGAATQHALDILAKNPKGFFLMVESDLHTTQLRQGLDRTLALDGIIQQTAARMKGDTLILFSADHSFDTRLRGGRRGEPLLVDGPAAPPPAKANVRVESGHTGEEVVVAAQGPGAQRVKGFFPNTHLFEIMLAAYGWQPRPGK